MRSVRNALQAEPLDLLATVSSMVQVFDTTWPRPNPGPQVGLSNLLDSFIEVERPETTALLRALAQLLPDEMARRRINAELQNRRHPLPTWLEQLAQVEVFGTRLIQHVLDDGDNFLIGLAGPGGFDLTIVAYVDHNMGTIVKDCFVVPEPLDDVESRYQALMHAEPHMTHSPVDAADARARIEPAIAEARGMLAPIETEHWPACKPLLEWALRLMPYGGAGYERPRWTQEERAALSQRFWASSWGRSLTTGEVHRLLDIILEFSCDHSWRRDPLRWSPVTVEVFWDVVDLPDPTGVVTLALGELLDAWIRFSHHERAIPADLTEQTVAAISRWAPVSPLLSGDMPWPADLDDDYALKIGSWAERSIVEAIGSVEVLAQMSLEPLAREEFSWEGIDEAIRPRVSSVLALLDQGLSQLPNPEYVTAGRRLLARVAAGEAKVFSHPRQKDEISAGTIGWLVAKANHLIPYGAMSSQDFMALFGLKTPSSQRAEVFLAAAGVHRDWGSGGLGSADYLVSDRRRALREYGERHGLLV